jgi:hypothetical protein
MQYFQTHYEEWRAQNANRKYPFADGASLLSNEGWMLNLGAILDARIYMLGATGAVYLSSIAIVDDVPTITIADSSAAHTCSTTIDVADATDTYALTDSAGRPAGVLVLDPNLKITAFSTNATFNQSATQFVTSVVASVPDAGLTGIVVNGEVLSGTVYLVGQNGVQLSVDGNNLRVDVAGDPYAYRRLSLEGVVPEPNRTAIKSVAVWYTDPDNVTQLVGSVLPNEYGEIHLVTGDTIKEDNILRVLPATDGLGISAIRGWSGGK